MNITVGCEDFLRILGRTQGVVDRRHSMAILTNLVIEAGASELAVLATDLEVSLRQTLAAKVTLEIPSIGVKVPFDGEIKLK